MKSIALVTYSKKPELLEGDNLLVEPFKKHGITPVAVPWDQKGVSWKDFDLVILRSCWDYHTRISEFISWLNELDKLGANLWNPVNIIKWNINKKYLLELEKMGVPVIPTLIFNKENINNIKKVIINNHWEEVVIKPAFGASSYKINRLNVNALRHLKGGRMVYPIRNSFQVEETNPGLRSITNILKTSELLVQPFVKEIQTEGEYSFIFFNKIYSHAILKKPKKNEYRSQIEFGGKELTIKPNSELILQAQKVIEKINSPLLYARIDCINNKGKLLLMELELTEPYLYFEKDEESAEKFVKAAVEMGS